MSLFIVAYQIHGRSWADSIVIQMGDVDRLSSVQDLEAVLSAMRTEVANKHEALDIHREDVVVTSVYRWPEPLVDRDDVSKDADIGHRLYKVFVNGIVEPIVGVEYSEAMAIAGRLRRDHSMPEVAEMLERGAMYIAMSLSIAREQEKEQEVSKADRDWAGLGEYGPVRYWDSTQIPSNENAGDGDG